DNTPTTLADGLTTFERLDSFRSDINLGLIYGKNTTYIPHTLLNNAEANIDWWRDMGDYSYDQYISSNYADSNDVANEASKFVAENFDNNFYLMVYFGVPDGAGHAFGENSVEYDASLKNVDDGLGILLDALDANGILANTKIVVSCDHGWNEGTSDHSTNDINTATILLISNDSDIVGGIYDTNVNKRRQCDIAPTTLDYFGMTPSQYSDINTFGCGSLMLAPALQIIVSAPSNGASSANHFMFIDTNVVSSSNSDVNFFLYGSSSSSNLGNSLLYRGTVVGGSGSVDYNWRSPVVSPDANTLLLFHFDNLSVFDENASYVHDFSGRNYNAYCIPGVSCPSVQDTNGYFGGTFDFDFGATGVCTDDCYFIVPDNADLTLDPQSTFSAWVYMDSGAFIDDYKILNQGYAASALYYNWGFTEDSAGPGKVRFRYNSGTAQSLYSDSNLPFDSWHHVALVRDGTALTFYLDGVADGTRTMNTALAIDPVTDFWIGDEGSATHSVTSEGWNGKIDEFAYWDRNLSAQEIASYYSLGYGTYYWDLNVSDVDNNVSSGVKSFTLTDGVGAGDPVVSVVKPVSGTFNKNSVSVVDVNVSVSDLDSNAESILVDLNYSSSQTEGTGTVILNDANLSEVFVCDSNDLSSARICMYHWDISSVPAGTYYILANVSDGVGVDFASGATSFTLTNEEITFVQDKNIGDTYVAVGTKTSRSITASLSAPATVGNLLVTAVSVDKNALAIVPDGFTLISVTTSNTTTLLSGLGCGFAYKVATGGETDITWTTDQNNTATMWVGEYSGLATTNVLDKNASANTGEADANLSIDTGFTGTTSQADELAIVIAGLDSGNAVTGDSNWNAGFIERSIHKVNSGMPFLSVGEKVLTSVGDYNATYTWAGTANHACSAIATFKKIMPPVLQQFILVGVDGMQYAHYREMMAASSLPNFVRLIGSNGFDGNATITGHAVTATQPGNAELNTGLGDSVTGVGDNTPTTLADGLTTFERLDSFRSDINLGLIYGKNTTYIPHTLLNNAEANIDWWRDMGDYSYDQYISSNYADSNDVANEASKFVAENFDNNFYLMVYFGVPDGAGHAFGENSVEYDASLKNVDDGLGILLDALDANGILANTKIVVSCDHGWNEGTSDHSTNDINTATILLISNDSDIVGGIYDTNVNKRRQCDIAPTTLDYFGMTPSQYSDINTFGCGSLMLAPALQIIVSAPSNGASSANHFMFIDTNVVSSSNSDVNFFLYGSSSSSNLGNSLLYRGTVVGGSGSVDYNWRSPVVSPDANTLLLFHFDNLSVFDENASYVHDFSGRNYNAYCIPGVSCPSVQDTNGYFGGTFDFDFGATGVCTDDCYFIVPDNADLTLDPQSTFSAWVYMDSGAFIDDYKILNQGYAASALYYNWGFTEDSAGPGKVRFRYNSGTAQSLYSDSNLPFDSWHHVALVRDGTALTFYLDGVADGTRTMNTALAIDPVTDFWIGDEGSATHSVTSEGWNGKIDEFAYWDRNLSAQEIASYYSLGYGTYYWDLNVSDVDNNVSSGVKSFTLTDGVGAGDPVVSVVKPVSGTFNKNSVSVVDVNVSVSDLDSNAESILVDLNYSSSQTEGTGTVILSDANLSEVFVCDSNDLSSARICTYHWNINSVPNGTYYISAKVMEGVNSDFASGATSFVITNAAAPIAFVQDKNVYNPYVAVGTKTSRSITASLASPATVGNLLVTAVSVDKNALAIVPDGFTLISSSSFVDGGVACGFAYKVATGGETDITWTTDLNNVASMWVGEYSGLATSDVLDKNSSYNSNTIAISSVDTGLSGTTSQADELAIVFAGIDSAQSNTSGAWSTDYTKRAEIAGTVVNGTPALSVGERILSSVGDYNAVYSWTPTGDQACAGIATFRKASNLPSVSVVSPVSGTFNKNSVSVVDVNISVSDLDSNAESFLVDLSYSSSQTEGTGSVILSDANLVNNFVCDSNDLSSARICTYHWDIDSVPNGTYYILAKVKEGANSDFASGATSFTTTNIVYSEIVLVQDKNVYDSPYANAGLKTSRATTLTLGSAATAGNLLVTAVSVDKNALAIVPSGFTLISVTTSNTTTLLSGVGCGLAYKVAAGGETSVTWTTDQNNVTSVWVGEYSGLETSDVLDKNASANTGATNANFTMNTGATGTTSQDKELAVVFFGADSGNTVTGDSNWSAGYTEHGIIKGAISGIPALSVGDRVLTSVGDYNATYTWAGTADQACAAIATFKASSYFPSSSPDVNVLYPVSGSFNKNSVSVVDVNISLLDIDTNAESFLVDLSYSSSQTEGTGTVILSDANLSEVFVCDSNDLSSARTCTYHWNIDSVPNGTYYISAKVMEGVNSDFASGATSFTITSSAVAGPLQQFILLGVDGMQYAHYREMMALGLLPNFVRLIGSSGFDGNATITGHAVTATQPGNAELNTGLGDSVTGVSDNTPTTLADGLTTFERLDSFRSDINLGLIYGKNTTYIPHTLLNNAEANIDWWRDMGDYSYDQYISSNYADSNDVANEASKFVAENFDNNFYLMVYFGVPDGAGHAFGENSVEYDASLKNVDDGLGILLDALDANGILANTKIVVSCDHGWNEGTSDHSTNDINTATILLISNDSDIVGGIYDTNVNKRRQCDIAPTTLDYFGMTPSQYSDINTFGCGSLMLAPALQIIVSAPSNGASSANHFMFIDTNVVSSSNSDVNFFLYGSSSSSNLGNSLLYRGTVVGGSGSVDYNWRSPVVSPDANTLLLFHFDNLSVFDENASYVHDFSGRNYNAYCIPGVSCPSVQDTNGYFGGTFDFDFGATGVCTDDCYFIVPDNADLTLDPQSTFSAWVYMDSGAFIDDYKILNQGYAASALYYNWGFTEDSAGPGKVRFRYNSGTAQSLYSDSNLPFDSWHHVALVRDGTALTFYLDGVADGTRTMNTALAIDPVTDFWIGDEGSATHSVTSEGWNGKIDEFAYWDRNLSAQEIASYYSLGYGTYYWDLNVSDVDNNVSSGVKSFTLTDGVGAGDPVVSVVKPVSGTFNKNSVSVVDVNVSVSDLDSNAESILVDLNYSSSQTEGTGTVIL
ncbi:MAG: alkaline phosphatase family protein, partial [Sphaerochaetaceae bacterium]|nr:alkaline phosphatase family protein [Sphaerochaetaceae bacterium]